MGAPVVDASPEDKKARMRDRDDSDDDKKKGWVGSPLQTLTPCSFQEAEEALGSLLRRQSLAAP